MLEPHPQPWWVELDRHRETEARARHAMQDRNDRVHDAQAARIDSLEAWRDQLRGAGRLVYLLIGSNLLLATTLVVQLFKTG